MDYRKGFVPTQYVDKIIAENRLKKANTSYRKYINAIMNDYIGADEEYEDYKYKRRMCFE